MGGRTAPVAVAAALASPLRDEALAFTALRDLRDGRVHAAAALPAVAAALAAPAPLPAPLGHLADRPLVMGIVNVTPDSFSGDGLVDIDAAIAHGLALRDAGADVLDIGGESTRPGATPVSPAQEMARVLPVVRALSRGGPVSIDTRNAATMDAALDAGAVLVNDVSALRHDPDAAGVVARHGAAVVLMHMRGLDPRRMQDGPQYGDVALDVARFLAERSGAAQAAGIARARILLDPGIGFGKGVAHNMALLDRLPLLLTLGCPVLVGVSRKNSVGLLSREPEPARRLAGSLAAALFAASRGAAILRVHDVAATVQALRVWAACGAGGIDVLP